MGNLGVESDHPPKMYAGLVEHAGARRWMSTVDKVTGLALLFVAVVTPFEVTAGPAFVSSLPVAALRRATARTRFNIRIVCTASHLVRPHAIGIHLQDPIVRF